MTCGTKVVLFQLFIQTVTKLTTSQLPNEAMMCFCGVCAVTSHHNRQTDPTVSLCKRPHPVPLTLVTLVVQDYDSAIDFFTTKLGFTLQADTPALTEDGQPKRWVVVAPPGGGAEVLLARADGQHQTTRIGDQTGGRVAFFLETDDFARDYDAFSPAGVTFVRGPKQEPYGTVAVFRDVAGNLWDLIERNP